MISNNVCLFKCSINPFCPPSRKADQRASSASARALPPEAYDPRKSNILKRIPWVIRTSFRYLANIPNFFHLLFGKKPSTNEESYVRRLETQGKWLSTGIFTTYAEKVKGEKKLLIIDCTMGTPMAICKNIETAAKEGVHTFLSVPIIDHDHIVHLLIEIKDRKATIEFFDARGGRPTCYQMGSYITVQAVMDAACETATGAGLTVETYTHTAAHQKDVHSCGVFACWHVKQRIQGGKRPEDLDDASKTPDIEAFRKELTDTFRTLAKERKPSNGETNGIIALSDDEF